MDRKEQLRLLRDWQKNDSAELLAAKETVKRLQPVVQNRDDLIASLEALEAGKDGSSAETEAPSGVFLAVPKDNGHIVERKPRLAAFRLVDAMGIVLGERYKSSPEDSAMHANELASAIFECQGKEEHFRAKNFVATAATKGVSEGLFLKTGRNEWRVNPEKINLEGQKDGSSRHGG